MSSYVMSDIHNDYDSFIEMLEKIGFSSKDTLYINGDIFDRGEKPIELYKCIRGYDNNIVVTQGNHDAWLAKHIRYYYENNGECKPYWYETFSLLQKDMEKEEIIEIADWIESLPRYLDIEVNGKKIYMAHAQTALNMGELSDDFLLMGRNLNETYIENGVADDVISIIGHTVNDSIRFWMNEEPVFPLEIYKNKKRNVYAIDTGNGYRSDKTRGGRLSCLRLEDMAEYYV